MGKVLVLFEESQVVAKAFRAQGHEAWSCDLKDCSGGHPEWHLKCKHDGHFTSFMARTEWDLIIMHPECTFTAVSGNRYYGKNSEKYQCRIKALSFRENVWSFAKICAKRVCMEQPKTVFKKDSILPKPQYIQPYQYGHLETKHTALFLHELPNLESTNNVYNEMMTLPLKKRHRIWYEGPGKNRTAKRSITFPGIAKAMADQWGKII